MNTPVIISILALAVSIIVGGASIYFNSKNSKHTDEKDDAERTKERIEEIKERTKENAVISGKLDLINSSNQEIKEQISSLVKKVDAHGDRLTKAEENIKQVWHEIKEIKVELNEKEDKK